MIDEFSTWKYPWLPVIPANILNPINTWTSIEEYAKKHCLIKAFESNFKQFQAACSDEICGSTQGEIN